MTLRESMRDYTPARFADVLPELASFGWRTLWAIALAADAAADWAIEGTRAKLPGVGTRTALPVLERDRDVMRGRIETDTEHVSRLTAWLELNAARGTMKGMTRELQNYLGRTNGGQWHTVMCVSRRNTWGIRREDGAYEYYDSDDIGATTWDWDSVSNPELSACWSDMWIIIVPPPYALHLGWFWLSPDSGFGHDSPQAEVAKIRELVGKWKAARTRVRSIIWSPKFVPAGEPLAGALAFDPLPGGPSPFLPDGTWGKWCKGVTGGPSVPSRPKWLRFWEF